MTSRRSDDGLGGLTELRKAVTHMVMVHYSERMQIRISKGRKLPGWGLGEGKSNHPAVLSRGLKQGSSSQLGLVTTDREHCQPGKLTKASVSGLRTGGRSLRHAAPP